MTVFKICPFAIFIVLFFSCDEKQATKTTTPSVMNRRLLSIKEVRRVIPNNSFIYYGLGKEPFFELIIKNISDFDFDYHYHKKLPLWVGACVEYINFPGTSTCMFFDDTSRVIKKNEEFLVHIAQFVPNSEFYKYEYQAIQFQLLISSSNDLSFYFESNPAKPIYKMRGINEGKKEYGYPLEFTYWTTTDLFWERYLLE